MEEADEGIRLWRSKRNVSDAGLLAGGLIYRHARVDIDLDV